MAGTVRAGSRLAADRVRRMFRSRGWGFQRLAESHAGGVAGDTLVAIALAGTLFFQVPTAEARENVALYLLITLAPFAVIGPFLGRVYERYPSAYRGGLVLSSIGRALVCVVMAIWLDTFLLFPFAFLLLVLSRFHGISRSSLLPVVLESRRDLVSANAQLARIGVGAAAVIVPIGAFGVWQFGPWFALLLAAICFAASALAATRLPAIDLRAMANVAEAEEQGQERLLITPRSVRLARFATAGVRFLNGFLLLIVAFAFRTGDAGILDFSAFLAAGGLGYYAAAFFTPVLDRHLSEEPMVVVGLAVEAGAAFVAAQVFGLPAAAALAAAAGFAWGTAKFGFDGLLQSSVPAAIRGRAFTNSETFFQVAWVLGALLPVIPGWPVEFGLIMAGLMALAVQVIYVSLVLVPVVEARRRAADPDPATAASGDVMDLLS